MFPKLIMLVGIPGSGKSTYAKKYKERYINDPVEIVSSDCIRKELYGDENCQDNPQQVFELMQERTLEYLANGVSVIYDATNLVRKHRIQFLERCPTYVQKEAHIIWSDVEECISRDENRDRTVGKSVITRMLKTFQPPYFDEGYARIFVIHPDNWNIYERSYMLELENRMNIDQHNQHHTKTVLKHCNDTERFLENSNTSSRCRLLLSFAGRWHDVGKPFTQTFTNRKGEPTSEAHYYGHQSYGAWLIYGLTLDIPATYLVDVAWLVGVHMDPYLNTKYWKALPKFLKSNVDLLHTADVDAH